MEYRGDGRLDDLREISDPPSMLEIKLQQDGPVTIVILLGDLAGEDVDRLAEKLAELDSEPQV